MRRDEARAGGEAGRRYTRLSESLEAKWTRLAGSYLADGERREFRWAGFVIGIVEQDVGEEQGEGKG